MKKILTAIFLTITLTTANIAQARDHDDDALWAIGGFILGNMAARDRDRDYHPHREEMPPPRRQPQVIPIYTTICEWREAYDYRGNPLPRTRVCHQEITGYREIYD